MIRNEKNMFDRKKKIQGILVKKKYIQFYIATIIGTMSIEQQTLGLVANQIALHYNISIDCFEIVKSM